MRYPYLLFDADDTLFSFEQANLHAFQTVCEAFDLPFSDALFRRYEKHNDAAWERLNRGLATKEEITVERYVNFLADIGVARDAAACNRTHINALGEVVFMMDHAEEVVKTLAKDHRLFLITNAVASVQRRRIGLSPIAAYIEASFISEEAGAVKPSRGYFDYVFARIDGITKDNCLVIGDSLTSDIRGANDYGLDSCWFNPKRKSRTEDVRIDYEIADLRELYGIV